MAKSPYQAIPPVGKTLEDLRASVAALEENVEILMGVRGVRGFANQVFVNTGPATPVGTKNGDIWLVKVAGTWTIKVWLNDQWA